ncbi:hypothetical protein Afil01_14400 [Actinorhabdospora filicis]|uniref:Uncharacterized protein n=1 Tax=Actinorhabdospora filicis TaxID=1785913 RepID=A0A9W6SII4_9ACTN|nr:hypothetical protein [Actinorhabdospora filicis]GLZ76633.1 hypothetical protein Afil01_14400 [Actinorhabdospora filicis]
MPTSVLLAILAAAGLLALAPALVRRYDAGERIAAEREASTARVLSRRDKKTTVAACAPEDEPESRTDDSSPGWQRAGRARAASVRLTAQASSRSVGETDVADNERRAWWRRRHRRILIGMLVVCLAELAGVVFLGPGFWIGFGVVFLLLLWYVRHLRLRALASGRTVRGEITEAPRVPRQVSAVAESQPPLIDPRWPDEPAPVLYRPAEKKEPEAVPRERDEDDDDHDDAGRPPVGREETQPPTRPKGIRGRSYESPAANV